MDKPGKGFIMAGSIGTGIICGLWAGFSGYFSTIVPELIAGWVGFVGCTSYFVAGCGRNGFIRSYCSNCAGILIGCTILALCNSISSDWWFNLIVTGFFSWVIQYISHIDLTRVVPCTFMGGFSAFATGGNWKMLLLCMILGDLVGLGSDYLGRWIYKNCMKKKDTKDEWTVVKILGD